MTGGQDWANADSETGGLTDRLVRFASGASRSADAADVRYDLISPHGHRRLAARYALGAKLHGDRNWEGGMPAGDVMNHLERHLNLWKAGDRSEDHLAAVAWGIYALMHYETTLPELVAKDFPEKT